MSVSFTSFQGEGNVTGSKHFLKIDGWYYGIDYGMWQGSQELELKNVNYKCPVPIDRLKHVLLTHAHADHCGLLPILVREGFQGNIYCTSATRDLANVVLMDSVKVSGQFTEAEVIDTMDHFRTHSYGKTKNLSDKLSYTAYNAGHILGSAFMSIDIEADGEKRNILFTGDIGRQNGPIVNEPDTNVPAPDYIVMESTYGNRLHEDLDYSLDEVARAITETIERGGKVLIPSFAIERAQEIIYHLKVLMMKNKIPKIPVFLDSPMATTATGVFQIHQECFNHVIKDRFVTKGKNPFSVSSLHIVKDNQESVKLAKSRKPCIVIAGNGMCTAGRILNHLFYGLANPKNAVLLVGYSSENSLARQLADGAEYVLLHDKEVFVEADVLSTGAFSAHADYNEMVNWLKAIDTSKLRKIFLVHGAQDSLEFFQKHLKENGFENVEIVVEGKENILE